MTGFDPPPTWLAERVLPYPDPIVLTLFGILALAFMLLMYALEGRGPAFTLAFALGCAASAVYGFVSGTWPFGVVEAIWCGVAIRRYAARTHSSAGPSL